MNPTPNHAPAAAASAALLLAAVAWMLPVQSVRAESVQRCEDAAGRITYSNESCPPGTRRSRAVDTSEPVVGSGPQRSAPAADKAEDARTTDKPRTDTAAKVDAKADTRADAKVEVERAGEKSAVRARAADTKQPTRTAQIDRTPSTAPATPVSVRKDGLCRDLATRVRFARQDLDSASPSQRASAELSLRRAQEEHDAECRTK